VLIIPIKFWDEIILKINESFYGIILYKRKDRFITPSYFLSSNLQLYKVIIRVCLALGGIAKNWNRIAISTN
jgi:hypothetical protein